MGPEPAPANIWGRAEQAATRCQTRGQERSHVNREAAALRDGEQILAGGHRGQWRVKRPLESIPLVRLIPPFPLKADIVHPLSQGPL
ncbi:hypothetical protein AAFF_G00056850 [Aldrovandia affinis]|uniref:Uncharacterized protein n=1 Tax=Aldrovandia affinis TaxID=143900 RepID=A0AAD7S0S7_9TELE|nr:hypothetical protein AAFF_G00056850 [Aldrovandia affinis]